MKPEPNPVDARDTLRRLAKETGADLSSLSRMVGRPSGYLGRFINRGSPRALQPEERKVLAAFFRVSDYWFGEDPPKR